MRQTATWLQQADLRPIIFRSYFGLQQDDHISILFQVTVGRSYLDLISGYSRPIVFRVTAGQSYFRTR